MYRLLTICDHALAVGPRLGDVDSLPRAAAVAMVGMKPGGRRRVLIPPGGWLSEKVSNRYITCKFILVIH